MWANRVYKQVFRELACARNGKVSYRNALFLPGKELLCVKAAQESGAIATTTNVIAVEQDSRTCRTIQKQLPEVHLRSKVHQKSLQSVSLSGAHLDFAFLDLCGQITSQLASWMLRWDGSEFVPGARVCWTFNLLHRYNPFVSALKKRGEFDGFEEVYNKLIRCSQISVDPGVKEWTRQIPSRVFYTVAATYGAMRGAYDVRIDRVHEYHDTVSPMLFLQTTILRRAVNRSRVSRVISELLPREQQVRNMATPDWALLGCPPTLSAGQKAKIVREARAGYAPFWIKPQEWAWHVCNPNSIRNRDKA